MKTKTPVKVSYLAVVDTTGFSQTGWLVEDTPENRKLVLAAQKESTHVSKHGFPNVSKLETLLDSAQKINLNSGITDDVSAVAIIHGEF